MSAKSPNPSEKLSDPSFAHPQAARIIHRGDAEIAEKNELAWTCAKKLGGTAPADRADYGFMLAWIFSASSASPR
jgi:hypothetical protein